MSRARGYRWAGAQNLLFELDSLDDVLALHACLRNQPLPGQIDLVPAACTLLIKYDTHTHAALAAKRVLAIEAPPVAADSGRVHDIEVIYDGDDLADVAEQTGLDIDGVIEAHTRQSWRAAFSGFAPGFVYLVGNNERLKVSRRDSPRTAVPPGSVGLAGAFSAIYPRESPGGWQLIGRTNAPIWDLEREPPALIQAGDTIRYIAVETFSASTTPSNEPEPEAQAPSPAQAEHAIEIADPGMQSLIQDLGRPGLAHLGVAASGAADEPAFRQANRLVGNLPGEAVIETVLGGLSLTARGNLVLARTGARGPADIRSPQGARTAPACTPFALHDGETLTLGTPEAGLRSYLAVRGGLDVPPVLHSRARDALAGIGPKPLAAGDMLPVAPARVSHVVGQPEPSTLAAPADDGATVLRIVLGPRDDWFDADTIARLTRLIWQPSQQSNRVGLRLTADEQSDDDGRLQRAHEGELPSEGCVAGAIQVPPSGQPVLFLKDHPVTGGYPVIGVVWPSDLSRAAQLAPGQPLRFAIVTPDGQPVAPAQGSNP